MKGPALLCLLLVGAVIGSAVAVVDSKHRSRLQFAELQELTRERDELNVEWGMLQLEQGAWATHGRIERLAREELQMRLVTQDDVVILKSR